MQLKTLVLPIVVASLLLANHLYLGMSKQHHQCINISGLQRKISTELIEATRSSEDMSSVAIESTLLLATNNARLLDGDLRIPDGQARMVFLEAQPALGIITDSDTSAVDKVKALDRYREQLDRVCLLLTSHTLQLLTFKEPIDAGALIVFSLALWLLLTPPPDSNLEYKRALQGVIANSNGCLVRCDTRIVIKSGVRFAKTLKQPFTSDIEGTCIDSYTFFPILSGTGTSLTKSSITEKLTQLVRADGSKLMVRLEVQRLTSEYAFVQIVSVVDPDE